MITTDNNTAKPLIIEEKHLSNLQKIANFNIVDITIENSPNLLIFPSCFKKSRDKIGDEKIFRLEGEKLYTGNVMGFIGVNNSELKIRSRFAQKDMHDYFLHYMLQKVFCVNIFDMKHNSSDHDDIFDFLFYLFPHFLKKALRRGLFKEYQHKKYNDANVRGVIDINHHIQRNIPFAGKVAYRTKEYSLDNRITQLIRHTLEHIRQHPFGQNLLRNDDDILQSVSQIVVATPTYNYRDRIKIINRNLKPLSHSFYNEYRELQQICMRILNRNGLKYGNEKDKVYGILFDGAWLWEEYLYTILKELGYNHPENKNSKGAICLFDDSRYPRYPDFWKKDIILDAKYKRLDKKNSELERNDIHQIITYMYVKEAKIGGFIHPVDYNAECTERIGELNGYKGCIYKYSIALPQNASNFVEFIYKMRKKESLLKDSIIRL